MSQQYTASRAGRFVELHNQHADETAAVPLKFPLVWLRDNCQCPQCFHRESTSRIIDWTKFDVNVQPDALEVREHSIFDTLVQHKNDSFQRK